MFVGEQLLSLLTIVDGAASNMLAFDNTHHEADVVAPSMVGTGTAPGTLPGQRRRGSPPKEDAEYSLEAVGTGDGPLALLIPVRALPLHAVALRGGVEPGILLGVGMVSYWGMWMVKFNDDAARRQRRP